MFGKLTLEQRKQLQVLLVKSEAIEDFGTRKTFLDNAGLGVLKSHLPMSEIDVIFAGALVRECERLGCPPNLGEFASVKLAVAMRNHPELQAESIQQFLNSVIAVYRSGGVQ